MPYYYKIKIKNFDEAYFNSLLKRLNTADKTLNAILMKGKGEYDIFTSRPLTIIEKKFLYFSIRPLVETKG